MSESLIDQDGGWIPFDERGRDGQLLTDSWHEEIETFESLGTFIDDTPEEVIFAEAEIKILGSLIPRSWQSIGSCVGSASGFGQAVGSLCDIAYRGDSEEIVMPFWVPTYGKGREKAGMNRPGSGSYGAAQAWAVKNFGTIHPDWEHAPKPSIRNGWAKYDSSTETKWSLPRVWPVSESETNAEAEKNQFLNVTRVTTLDGLKQAIAQGYPCTAASSYGSRSMRVDSSIDILVAPWNGSWQHQMLWDGYTVRGGRFYVKCQNQWGPTAHPTCPTLSKIKGQDGNVVNGSFWIPENDVESILRRGEVYTHGNSEGWPPRKIDWGQYSGFKFD